MSRDGKADVYRVHAAQCIQRPMTPKPSLPFSTWPVRGEF